MTTLLVSSRIPIDGWLRAAVMIDVATQQVFKHCTCEVSWNASQLKISGPLRLTLLTVILSQLAPKTGARVLQDVLEYKLRRLSAMWPQELELSARWSKDVEVAQENWRTAEPPADDYNDSGSPQLQTR